MPAARTSADPTISRSAGWTLEVVYQNASLPLRNLSVYAGQEIIDASSPPVDATISGFATPATGAVTGRVLVTAQEGDSNISGDQLRFGPNASATVALFGPRNPANNFFQSQICNDSGNLDTSGTFGDLNQPLGSFGCPKTGVGYYECRCLRIFSKQSNVSNCSICYKWRWIRCSWFWCSN